MISTTSTAVSAGSAPIATSTPVNFASGPVSPPPLTLASGPAHQEPVQASSTASKANANASYPAVLKGRTAASPPNPNLVPSGKVPPPVPPRGTGQSRARSSEEHRGPGTATSTSSITSSRGDEADIITRYRLHDRSSYPHHQNPSPDSHTNVTNNNQHSAKAASAYHTANTTTSDYHATSFTATTTTTTHTYDVQTLHARTSTPAYLPPKYDSLAMIERSRNVAAAFDAVCEEDDRWDNWEENIEEDDEFVSVERVNGSYVIRTSPFPFRPERGNFVHPRVQPTQIPPPMEEQAKPKTDTMAKFTYFLNPASRPELMNYKMSRKDKKHSETYYERMKRKQRELEASLNTITTLTRRSEHAIKVSEEKTIQKADRAIAKIDKAERIEEKKIVRFPERRRESRLLKKIREKSAQRRKKLAPEPTLAIQTFDALKRIDYSLRDSRKKPELPLRPSFISERLARSTGDVRDLQADKTLQLQSEKRTFMVTRVEELKRAGSGLVHASSQVKIEGEFRLKKGEDEESSKQEDYHHSRESVAKVQEASTSKKKKDEDGGSKGSKEEIQDRSSSRLKPNRSFLHSYQLKTKRY